MKSMQTIAAIRAMPFHKPKTKLLMKAQPLHQAILQKRQVGDNSDIMARLDAVGKYG